MRAAAWANCRNGRDVCARCQRENRRRNIRTAFAVGDRGFSQILHRDWIRDGGVRSERKYFEYIAIDRRRMVARRCEHSRAGQGRWFHRDVARRRNGLGSTTVARDRGQRITTGNHVVPRHTVRTAGIAAQQDASLVEVHARDGAIGIAGRRGQHD